LDTYSSLIDSAFFYLYFIGKQLNIQARPALMAGFRPAARLTERVSLPKKNDIKSQADLHACCS
jgi:hypothetical protein